MSKTSRLGTLCAAGLAAVFAIAAGSASAQQIVIDASTGQPITLNGLSSGAVTTLQNGGQVPAILPNGNQVVLRGEIYKPGIWVDPDGCQHWVMDDGIEGYMAPRLRRDGMPVCGIGRDTGLPPQQMVVKMYDVPYHGGKYDKW